MHPLIERAIYAGRYAGGKLITRSRYFSWVSAASRHFMARRMALVSDELAAAKARLALRVPRRRVLIYSGYQHLTRLFRMALWAGQGEEMQLGDLRATLHCLNQHVDFITFGADLRFKRKHLARYDLIFSDYAGCGALSEEALRHPGLYILDSFGTSAQYQHQVSADGIGGLGLPLSHFLSFHPELVEGNGYLGFIAPRYPTPPRREWRALMWGKGAVPMCSDLGLLRPVLERVNEHIPLHTTVGDLEELPDFSHNHGLLPPEDYVRLLCGSSVLIGIGAPLFGNAWIEALFNGVAYINPRFEPPLSAQGGPPYVRQSLRGKPNQMVMDSQVPYAARHLAPPYCYTVDLFRCGELEDALCAIRENPPPLGFDDPHFSAAGMLQRVAALLEATA